MYTVLSEKPLNLVTLAVLEGLHKITNAYAIDYFVIGATARDILMTHVFGIEIGRGDFQPAANQAHRLY